MANLSTVNIDKMRNTLIELGIYEAEMDVKDMEDLIVAIKNSQTSALEEERVRETLNEKTEVPKKGMQRRYITALERRMPWSLFPIPEQLSMEQRVQVMAAYKEQQNICRYRKAKTSIVFAEWNCVFSIPISKQRQVPDSKSGLHHTRSGRLLRAAPHYTDDGSDSETGSITKKCRKKVKISTLSKEYIISKSSLFRDTVSPDIGKMMDSKEAAAKENALKQQNKKANGNYANNRLADDMVAESPQVNEFAIREFSSSPEITASKMTVVAQVHREFRTPDKISTAKNAHCDSMEEDQETLGMSSRKRPKRLKLVAENE